MHQRSKTSPSRTNTPYSRQMYDNITDLFSQYDQLSFPCNPIISSVCSQFDENNNEQHIEIKEECKMISDSIDLELKSQENDEKYKSMYSHFMCLLYQHKKLEKEFNLLQNLCNRYEKEKEIMLTDHTKAEVVKNTLEGLCREFQKQNKQLMIECNQIEKSETQKREELLLLHEKEKSSLTQKIQSQNQQIINQEKHSDLLKNQVCNLQEQYKCRENQIVTELKTKALEVRLIQAKSAQQVKLSQQQVLKISEAYQKRIKETQNNESEMQNHLKQYTEKFEQFQDTLSKSNEIFATFKQEMERMTKTIARLEKDRSFLQAKCEQSDITLIEMAEERNTQRRELEILKTKNTRLGALCRVLQAERRKEDEEEKKPKKLEKTCSE